MMFATNKLNKVESTRVVIIGAGSVGATSAFALLIQGIASEIVLIDRDAKKAEGEVMDLEHGAHLPRTRACGPATTLTAKTRMW